jgi:hypothetical protein
MDILKIMADLHDVRIELLNIGSAGAADEVKAAIDLIVHLHEENLRLQARDDYVTGCLL